MMLGNNKLDLLVCLRTRGLTNWTGILLHLVILNLRQFQLSTLKTHVQVHDQQVKSIEEAGFQ